MNQEQWRKEIEKKAREKLGMSETDSTLNRPDYWKTKKKLMRKHAVDSAKVETYELSDKEVEHFPNYGWSILCSWCHSEKNLVVGQELNGATFKCVGCGHKNKIRQKDNLVRVFPMKFKPTVIFWALVMLVVILIIYLI